MSSLWSLVVLFLLEFGSLSCDLPVKQYWQDACHISFWRGVYASLSKSTIWMVWSRCGQRIIMKLRQHSNRAKISSRNTPRSTNIALLPCFPAVLFHTDRWLWTIWVFAIYIWVRMQRHWMYSKKLAELNSSYPNIDKAIKEIRSHIDEATRLWRAPSIVIQIRFETTKIQREERIWRPN